MKRAVSRALCMVLSVLMTITPMIATMSFGVFAEEAPASEATEAPVVSEAAADDLAGVAAMESKNGSFRIEAEDMYMVSPYRIVQGSESDSGGKYVDTPHGEYPVVSDPINTDKPQLRTKFKVEKSGEFVAFLRFRAIDGNSDSTWVAVDNGEYKRWNFSARPEWGWSSLKLGNLEEGWHTLDFKYREAGLRLDLIYICPAEANHTQKWFGSYPGEEPKPTPEEIAIKKIELNGTRIKLDVSPVVEGDAMYASVEGLCSYLGATYKEDGKSFKAERYSNSISGAVGSNKLTVNGKTIEMKKPAFIEGNRIFVEVITVLEAFGAKCQWNASFNQIIATYTAEADPVWPSAAEGEVLLTPYYRAITYKIPYENKDAKVEVFYRNKSSLFWSAALEPVYQDGAFCGSFSRTGETGDYIVRVKITENGVERNMLAYTKTLDGKNKTHEEMTHNPEDLLLSATFENIGYYIQGTDESTNCRVTYRKAGDKDWKVAYAPYYDEIINQYRGSIVELEENTEYEVRAQVTVKSNTVRDITRKIKTWSSDVPVAKEINIKDLYTPGKPVVIHNLKGTAEGWIKINGEGTTVEVGNEFMQAIAVSECQYLIFENLNVKGAQRDGLQVYANSNDIHIRNSEFTGWGRVGNFDSSTGCYRLAEGSAINNDAAIYLSDVSRVVVEGCYVHDANGRSNAWNGPTWVSIHPEGPNAIYMRGVENNVIRYNDFVGSDEHRWNDSIETYSNSLKFGGIGADSDVYGNYLVFGQDDSTELDGGQMNSRFYRNKIEGFLCGVSTAATTISPSYLFRNLIVNPGDEMGKSGGAFKTGWSGTPLSIGLNYYLHNTVIWSSGGIAETSGYHNPFSRNNILDTGSKTGASAIAITSKSPLINFDFDLYYGVATHTDNPEQSGVFGQATFVNKANADFRLVKGSLGINKGQWLNNFSEGSKGNVGQKPDMGAMEMGEDTLFPYRPIDIRADKYQLNFNNTVKTETVTFKIGNVSEGTKYQIRKNDVFDWFEIEGELTGELKSNSTLTFTVKGIAEKVDEAYRRGNGAFLLRLSNGMSVPVTVYLEK